MKAQAHCDFESLSPHTGVEVRGLDLRKPLSDALAARLNQAFVERSVLVIREQQLEPAQLLEAVQLFGDVFVQHNNKFALPECPQIHYISNQDCYPDGKRYIPGAGYHTDHSNAASPPKATVLHAIDLPSEGGDTQFVNMQQAYASLSSDMQARIEGLQAVHVFQSRHSERQLIGLSAAQKEKVPTSVRHPLVTVHPQSGRKALYINPIRIDAIDGMGDDEALELLDQLLAHAIQQAHQYRHQWQVGDLVLWDNRSLLHKANADYDMGQKRYLLRVMLRDDSPTV